MADPVTIGMGAMALGGGISAISGYHSDLAQADAERQNAAFFRTQAEYSKQATERDLDIFGHQTEDLLARQTSAYARSGVDLAGSPLMLIGQTKSRADDQFAAIREKGRQDVEIALMKAQDASGTADDVESGAKWKAIGSLFSMGGSILSKAPAKGSSTSGTPTMNDTGAGTYTSGGGNIPKR